MGRIGEARMDFVADASGASAEVQQLTALLIRQEQELQQIKARMHETGAVMRSEYQETRGAVRLFNEEIGIKSNRELTNILAQTSIIGPAIRGAFSALAVVGFVEILVQLSDKVIEVTNYIAGFGEEVQKQYQAQLELNHRFAESADARKKIEREIALINLDGSKRQAEITKQQKEDLDAINKSLAEQYKQRQALQSTAVQTRTITRSQGVRGTGGTEVTSVVATDAAIDAQQKIKGLDQSIADLQRQQGDLQEGLKKTGAEFKHSVGEEGAEAARKAKAEFDKLNSSFTQIGERLFKDTHTASEVVDHEYGAMIKTIQDFAAKYPQYEQRANQLVVEATQAAAQKKLEIIQKFDAEVQKIESKRASSVLAIFPEFDLSAPIKQAREMASEIKAVFEAERSQEEAIRSQSQADGEPILETERKILDVRKKTNDELRLTIDAFSKLASQIGAVDPQLSAQAAQFKAKLEIIGTGFKSIGTQVKDFALKDMGNFFQELISGSQSASEAFKHFAQSILSDLASIIVKTYILFLLNKALGFLGGGGGGASSGTSGINPTYQLPTLTSAIPHAMGGSVSPGVPYLVGERGPELMVPSTHGSIVPNGALGGSQNVQVNVINQSSQDVSAREQSRNWDDHAKQFVVNVVLEDLHKNGPLRTAMAR